MSERKQLRSSKKLESHFVQGLNENKHKQSSLFTPRLVNKSSCLEAGWRRSS